MLHATVQMIIVSSAAIMAGFVTWHMMAHFYDDMDWSTVSASGIVQRDQVMQMWQFLPLFVIVLIMIGYYYYRVSRHETTQENYDGF